MRKNKEGKWKHARLVDPVVRDIEEGFEKDLISKGLKWSPVKLYYKRFTRTVAPKNWRLVLRMLHRANFVQTAPQDVTLLITIRDPHGQAYVYDGMVREMTRLNWQMHNLQIRSRAK